MNYRIDELTESGAWRFAAPCPVIGLDIGSRGSKGVLLTDSVIHTLAIPTGLFMQETADELIARLLAASGVSREAVGVVVATGYGRIALAFEDIPFDVVTEISCHAMGAHALHPTTRTIVDIGGQDSKAIKLDPATGKVDEFVMNDKCAAGTGRFLEKAAVLLGLRLDELGPVALGSKAPVDISSQCVVFAESEMISLRAQGDRNRDPDSLADIVAGVHYSAARRVRNLLGRVGREPDLVFTGGVSANAGMRKALEDLIGSSFLTSRFDLTFAGALGAAVFASGRLTKRSIHAVPTRSVVPFRPFAPLNALIERAHEEFIHGQGPEKRIGHFCAYTPLEILDAFGLRHARLFKAGDSESVAAGELHTQSVFCDFSKSCIGGFETKDPLYARIDKVYNFHTCAQMKRVTEVIETLVPTRLLNLPRVRDSEASRDFFRQEIGQFVQDLSALTGRSVTQEEIAKAIVLRNRLRTRIREISELRRRPVPPLSGDEFLDVVRAWHYVPAHELLPVLDALYEALDATESTVDEVRPLRVMVAGSVVADGDRRLVEILERDLGVRIVVEDHCTGAKLFQHRVEEGGDPLRALAEGYLDQAPCARMKSLEDSVQASAELALRSDVDGIVYVYQKFCSCYGVTKIAFLERYRELGLPALELSSDYSGNDHGQLKTRIEAFLEVLNQSREVTHGH